MNIPVRSPEFKAFPLVGIVTREYVMYVEDEGFVLVASSVGELGGSFLGYLKESRREYTLSYNSKFELYNSLNAKESKEFRRVLWGGKLKR